MGPKVAKAAEEVKEAAKEEVKEEEVKETECVLPTEKTPESGSKA
jgi:hypothetical protein